MHFYIRQMDGVFAKFDGANNKIIFNIREK